MRRAFLSPTHEGQPGVVYTSCIFPFIVSMRNLPVVSVHHTDYHHQEHNELKRPFASPCESVCCSDNKRLAVHGYPPKYLARLQPIRNK